MHSRETKKVEDKEQKKAPLKTDLNCLINWYGHQYQIPSSNFLSLKMLIIEGIRNCASFQLVKCQINIRYFVMINQFSHLNWDHTICTRKILCCHSLPFPTYQLLREKIQIDNSKPMLQTKRKKKEEQTSHAWSRICTPP